MSNPKQRQAAASKGKPGPKVAKSKRASQRQEVDHPVFSFRSDLD